MIQPDNIRAKLRIDLNAVADNWRELRDLVQPADCAAVVKANAYGLGDRQVVSALRRAGCKTFFVACVDEALAIAPLLEPLQRIFILHGLGRAETEACRTHGFIPVLSTVEQIEDWQKHNLREQRRLCCAIQVDTGMNRLGLAAREWRDVVSHFRADELGPVMVMSHLACAEDSNNALNVEQWQRFRHVLETARQWSPDIKASFANSSAVLLGSDYHFDQVRPGIALYGGNPAPGSANRFRAVVSLRLPILQLRRVDANGFVGYGATARAAAGALLATVHSGYADGLLIAQSKAGYGEIAGVRVPMLGRISMDLIVFDVSAVPASVWQREQAPGIDVLNETLTIDTMAQAANTISYEVLCRLGQRFERTYTGAPIIEPEL